jgi:hypothetical protein
VMDLRTRIRRHRAGTFTSSTLSLSTAAEI